MSFDKPGLEDEMKQKVQIRPGLRLHLVSCKDSVTLLFQMDPASDSKLCHPSHGIASSLTRLPFSCKCIRLPRER